MSSASAAPSSTPSGIAKARWAGASAYSAYPPEPHSATTRSSVSSRTPASDAAVRWARLQAVPPALRSPAPPGHALEAPEPGAGALRPRGAWSWAPSRVVQGHERPLRGIAVVLLGDCLLYAAITAAGGC